MRNNENLIDDFPSLPPTLRLTPEEMGTLKAAAGIATRLANQCYEQQCYDAADLFDETWIICCELRNRLRGDHANQ